MEQIDGGSKWRTIETDIKYSKCHESIDMDDEICCFDFLVWVHSWLNGIYNQLSLCSKKEEPIESKWMSITTFCPGTPTTRVNEVVCVSNRGTLNDLLCNAEALMSDESRPFAERNELFVRTLVTTKNNGCYFFHMNSPNMNNITRPVISSLCFASVEVSHPLWWSVWQLNLPRCMMMVGNQLFTRPFLHWYYTHTVDANSMIFLREEFDYEVHVTRFDGQMIILKSRDVFIVVDP